MICDRMGLPWLQARSDPDYIPTPEEVAELAEIDEAQRLCKRSHAAADLDPEDGCLECGYGSK